jgi:EAL domain-containing protein (putative c-di-GMP-specific phosphodiesterase class I)
MKVEVIAESVEEAGAVLKLKMHRISFAQGFGIYMPHPIDVFMEASTQQAA